VPVDITAAQGQAFFNPTKLAVEVAADFGLDSGRLGTGVDSASPSQPELAPADLGGRPAKKGPAETQIEYFAVSVERHGCHDRDLALIHFRNRSVRGQSGMQYRAFDGIRGHQVVDDVCLGCRQQLPGVPAIGRLAGFPPTGLQRYAQTVISVAQSPAIHEDSLPLLGATCARIAPIGLFQRASVTLNRSVSCCDLQLVRGSG
jgi:hypothetical protein